MAEQKYIAGKFLMWSGVILCAVGVLVINKDYLVGGILFLAGLGDLGIGIFLRKKFCPHCRDNNCAVDPTKQ